MQFTEGNNRFYERMMQEPPNFNKGKKNKKTGDDFMDFKYKFEDMNCCLCAHYKKCPFEICPEIIENLEDLREDAAFADAVYYAENCTNKQKCTLLMLKSQFEDEGSVSF